MVPLIIVIVYLIPLSSFTGKFILQLAKTLLVRPKCEIIIGVLIDCKFFYIALLLVIALHTLQKQ